MSAGFALLALSVATGESSVHGSRTASYSVNSASSTSEGSGSNGSSTDEEIGSVTILVLASSILGVGNALSAGILMTVAADAAPPDATSRARFIGLFKVVSDSGTFAGPMIVGVVSQYVGLPSACVLLCAFTLSIAVWYAALGPEGLASPATNSSQPAGAELHSCADDSPTRDACAPSSIRMVTASSAGEKRWRLRGESQARLVDHDSAALNRSDV
jgi:MFS family permease